MTREDIARKNRRQDELYAEIVQLEIDKIELSLELKLMREKYDALLAITEAQK